MDIDDPFDLSGRRAIVTGGAGLLGREFADALAARGAVVTLVDVDGPGVDQVASDIAAAGSGRAIAMELDITDEDAVDRYVGGLAGVDILVNSAAIDPKVERGGLHDGRLDTYPLDQWEASLRVNLTGTFLMTRAVCRIMQTQGSRGSGVVVNISSTYGLVGPDQRIYERSSGDASFKPVDYSVTKAGILGFTRAAAAMYRGTDIRVNALSPGGTENGQDREFIEQYEARTVMGRMAAPEDYRSAIVFLCSDASSYMTGSNLVIDGGWTTC